MKKKEKKKLVAQSKIRSTRKTFLKVIYYIVHYIGAGTKRKMRCCDAFSMLHMTLPRRNLSCTYVP